jgi:8-oxo-dGTP pyrophosphatase MutT (NUDIX family)
MKLPPLRHPFPNDAGEAVLIHRPSRATSLASWLDPAEVATVVPGGELPAALNGVPLSPCGLPPLEAANPVAEPPYVLPAGFRAAAGVIIIEDDGRVWLVSPTNGFGGYAATFPKGRVDAGGTLQHTAVREAFEESGLVVRLEAFLLDARRTQTFTRYYVARRAGGSPAAMGWETQAVHLVPAARLEEVAVHPNDAAVIMAAGRWMAGS